MPDRLLVVPLGYGWVQTRGGNIVSDAQGEERIKAAVDYGTSESFKNKDVLFGAFPGIIPPAKGGDGKICLCDAMTNTFLKFGITRERVIRGEPGTWGTHGEVREALRLGEAYRRKVVFFTSSFHIARLSLVCDELIGSRAVRHKMLWNMLELRACGNKHVTVRDVITEPVKFAAQALRIPFGSFMPKTLRGRL